MKEFSVQKRTDLVAVKTDEGYDVYAQSMAEYDRQHLVNEMY